MSFGPMLQRPSVRLAAVSLAGLCLLLTQLAATNAACSTGLIWRLFELSRNDEGRALLLMTLVFVTAASAMTVDAYALWERSTGRSSSLNELTVMAGPAPGPGDRRLSFEAKFFGLYPTAIALGAIPAAMLVGKVGSCPS